jgi:hypothetical protein
MSDIVAAFAPIAVKKVELDRCLQSCGASKGLENLEDPAVDLCVMIPLAHHS